MSSTTTAAGGRGPGGFLTPVEDPRARRRRSWVLDVVVLLVTTAVSLPNAVERDHGGTALLVVGWVGMLLPLLVRRIWPLPVFVVVLGVAVAVGWWLVPVVPAPALIVALYTVASRNGRAPALWAAGALLLAAVAAGLVVAGAAGAWWAPPITLLPFTVAAVGIGLYVATRRTLLLQLRERAAQLERERDQQGELAAAAERSRIAREMHDIVAHHLTVMVALSDGAVAASAKSPDRAAEVMRTVSATGRQALADTRRLLGVLRDDADGTGQRRPLPDLSDLDSLVHRVRDAGLPVRYDVRGAHPEVPPAVQLTVYRLIQEALTNTMKHAGPGASAKVSLSYATDAVTVEVLDDGAGARSGSSGAGRGLAGMRERVAAFGGEVRTGPVNGAGWRVLATVRLDGADGADGADERDGAARR